MKVILRLTMQKKRKRLGNIEPFNRINCEGTTIMIVTNSTHDSQFAHSLINLFDGQMITAKVKKQVEELLVNITVLDQDYAD